MNNQEAAAASFRRAEAILDEAQRHSANGAWNLVVRRAQETVEIGLKGALLWGAVDVPRAHDVGPALRRNAHRFPEAFASRIPRLASISRALRVERERSFYGDEESGLPPEELYDDADAREALERATYVLDACRQSLA